MESLLQEAIRKIKQEEKGEARQLLQAYIQRKPDDERGWLWLLDVADNDRERMVILRQILRINPENQRVKQALQILQTRKQTGGQVVAPEHIQRVQEDGSSIVAQGEDVVSHSEASQVKTLQLSGFKRFVITVQLAWRRFRISWEIFSRNRLAVFGVVLLFLFAMMAISHPILLRTVWPRGIYDPITGFDLNVMHPSPPSKAHLLGTDSLGRDVFSMLLAATRPAFVLGITAALVTAVVSIFVAVVSVYYGGIIDGVFSRISDAFLLLPAPLFMVVVGVAFREFDAWQLGAIFGLIAGLGGAAITLRAYAQIVMAKPFVEATRIAGGGAFYIIRRHLVPHMIPLAGTLMMVSVVGAVVADAFVSFFGVTRLYLNWGTMIYTSQVYGSVFGNIEWHVLLPPSLALSLFATTFYLIARGMQEVADPKLRSR